MPCGFRLKFEGRRLGLFESAERVQVLRLMPSWDGRSWEGDKEVRGNRDGCFFVFVFFSSGCWWWSCGGDC